jgi:hypothetical protein
MAAVRIHDAAKMNWRAAGEVAAERGLTLQEEFKDTSVLFHERGDEEHLQLFELRFPPNAAVDIHAHGEDEIIYVAGGSMKLGARSIGPGSSVFVAGRTLYSFAAGEDGLHILNFRPRRDESHLGPDDIREAREHSRAAAT